MATKQGPTNRKRKQISVSLSDDTFGFINDSVKTTGMSRARVVDYLVAQGKGLLVADHILQCLGLLQAGRTDTEHLETCRDLIALADKLIGETGSQVLKAVAIPLASAIQEIDDQWLRTAVDGAAAAKKEPAQ